MTERQYILARNRTENSLLLALKNSGYEEKFFYDQINEYMLYYDSLFLLNEKLLQNKGTSSYFDILKEKRLLTKEMRNILSFLKLEPTEVGGIGGNSKEENL